MPEIATNGITLFWEGFGDPKDPPLLLVMGLSAQMVLWPEGFCRALAARGFYVIRFDNRDVGRSTKLHGAGVPPILPRLAARAAGVPMGAPYTLSDMAKDVVGLMDGLGFDAAHVVGMSMGGMIAQTIAIEHPRRLLSLVSLSSSTAERGLPLATAGAARALLASPPRDREAAIRHGVGVMRAIGSPVHFDEAQARAAVELSISRSTYRVGAARQLAAILAAPARTSLLAHVRVPATVIHGRLDPLLPLAHGEATARAIPGARLVVLDTMGHDVPEPLWTEIIDAIALNTVRTREPSLPRATA
jgi:pimeloyl-ACP methyl ester carboxylesterase